MAQTRIGPGGSAYMGQPPATDEDYWIAASFWHLQGVWNANISQGYTRVAKPPPGYTHQSFQSELRLGLILLIVYLVLFTGGRLCLRCFVQRLRWGPDDWFVILACASAVTYCAVQIGMVHYGGGLHLWELTYHQYSRFYTLSMVDRVIFYVTVGLTKISIALFIRRLTGLSSRGWRVANNIYLFIVFIYIVVSVFWNAFECIPVRSVWDRIYMGKLTTPARCSSTPLRAKSLNAIHVITDFVLLVAPVFILWKIKLPLWTKIRICMLFLIGTASCVISILRIYAAIASTADFTYTYLDFLIWNLADQVIAITVASLPVMHTFTSRRGRFMIQQRARGFSNARLPPRNPAEVKSVSLSSTMSSSGASAGDRNTTTSQRSAMQALVNIITTVSRSIATITTRTLSFSSSSRSANRGRDGQLQPLVRRPPAMFKRSKDMQMRSDNPMVISLSSQQEVHEPQYPTPVHNRPDKNITNSHANFNGGNVSRPT